MAASAESSRCGPEQGVGSPCRSGSELWTVEKPGSPPIFRPRMVLKCSVGVGGLRQSAGRSPHQTHGGSEAKLRGPSPLAGPGDVLCFRAVGSVSLLAMVSGGHCRLNVPAGFSLTVPLALNLGFCANTELLWESAETQVWGTVGGVQVMMG